MSASRQTSGDRKRSRSASSSTSPLVRHVATPPTSVPSSPQQGRQSSSGITGLDTSTLPPSTAAPRQPERRGKKRRHSKAGGAETPTPQPSADAAAAAKNLLERFSEVELQLQLENDRAKRAALQPRDVGNLLLWCVPSPIPLIEAPRIFFIKNKSRVQDVVLLYVNGWSYDEMLCTGVGLPRDAGAASPPATAATDATWNEGLCAAMLKQVREGRCWAREGRGTGCAGGVQYAPLTIANLKNELESDLFWRSDAPRQPRDNGVVADVTSPHVGEGKKDSGDRKGWEEEEVEMHKDSTPTSVSRGVGNLFQSALHAHRGTTPVTSSGGANANPPPPSTEPSIGADGSTDAFNAFAHLWQDAALLSTYALQLPQNRREMIDLGYEVVVPRQRQSVEKDDGDAHSGGKEEEEEGGERDPEWCVIPSPFDEVTDKEAPSHRVLALDCEMVQVEGGESALARATLIDVSTGRVVMDRLVKPSKPVINYLTRFSGIDEAMLGPVTTTLTDCQTELRQLIHRHTFVIGHSLENDFKACKVVPLCAVLDTAWLFPHPSGLPYKNALRFLAQRYLRRRIQQGSHDSSIDAMVSAELVQLKLQHGPSFGVRPRVSVLGLIASAAVGTAEEKKEDQQAAEATGAPHPSSSSGTATGGAAAALDVRVHLYDDATRIAAIMPPSSSAVARVDAIPVRNDEDATRKATRALSRRKEAQRQRATAGASFHLYWIQLSSNVAVDVVQPPPSRHLSEEEVASHTATQLQSIHATNSRVLRIVDACPDGTVVVVVTGSCDGERSGNHFSRAQGTCFLFVKDHRAQGPSPKELHGTLPNATSGHPDAVVQSAATTMATGHASGGASVTTPPACEAQ